MQKKFIAILVASLFIFCAVVPAFAWTSFQNSNSLNNGLIDDGYIYPTSTPSVNVYYDLTKGAWSGIECSPVVQVENGTPYAYVLHTASSGTKLAKVDLTSPGTAITGWPADGIEVNTSGGFQMSTPIIVNDTLYCAGNVFANIIRDSEFDVYDSNTFTYWTVTPGTGVTCSQSVISTDNYALKAEASVAGSYNVTAYQDGFSISSTQANSIRIAGGIKLTDVSSVTVTVTVNGDDFVFGYNSSDPDAIPLVLDNGLYIWNENIQVSSNSASYMQVYISFTTTAANGSVELDYAELYKQSAGIGKIENVSTTTTPTYVGVTGDINGQINTPITSDGTYLYFGTYATNGAYYGVNINTNNCVPFNMTNNSAYWTGAAVCGDYLVFGTEKGTIYVLNKETMGFVSSDTLSGSPFIRSSICAIQNGSDYTLYFTSRTNNSGSLWCYTLDDRGNLTANWSQDVGYTNSTPTVSGNYVYVGGSAGVKCFDTTSQNTNKLVWSSSTFASAITAVQASPVVYSVTSGDTVTDYIYVTTNQAAGQCYCISYVHGATSAALAWNTNVAQGLQGATYTLQGVAAGKGYLVFGNDYANLIIMHDPGVN